MYLVLVVCLFAPFCTGNIFRESFLERALKHEVKGQSLGSIDGRELYEYEGHTYTFHRVPSTWDEAYKTCWDEDGYLAILEDIHEVDFVSNAMDGNLCTYVTFQNVWIGGRFVEDVKRWKWITTDYEIKGKVGVDDGYPPWKINLRPGYDCLLLNQDLTHKPKFSDLECYRKRRFLCEQGCFRLYDTDNSHWEPEECVLDPNHPGDKCTLVCNSGFVQVGSQQLTCTDKGWESEDGFNTIPICRNGDDIGDDIIDKINQTLTKDVELLFIVDESVDIDLFQLEKQLTKSIVRTFPLSDERSAGTITYYKSADVDITITTADTCRFLKLTDRITKLDVVDNDLNNALLAAKQEIETNRIHDLTVVIIITGSTNESVDASQTAEDIKSGGDIIITIGVNKHNRNELISLSSRDNNNQSLFFEIGDENVLSDVVDKINRDYAAVSEDECNNVFECDGLDNTDRGHWEPASCNVATEVGHSCLLVCNDDYSVHGPADIMCTEEGWTGPAGVTELPKCYTPDEIGNDFGDKVNQTLSKYQNASMLFILDESGSVPDEHFVMEKDFVKSIINAFPLSPIRKGGLITFSTHADVDITLTETDSCTFFKKLDRIKNTGGYTHIDEALILADLETVRNNPDEKTLIFLITDGKSQTDPQDAADQIKGRENIIFTVGVAQYDEKQLIPISSIADDGSPNFFGVTSFEVFDRVSDYLNQTYSSGEVDCTNACKQLEDTDRGSWLPSECSQKDSETGQVCQLVCESGYEMVGSRELRCTEDGWTGTGGDFVIPKCKSPEEIGDDFIDKINGTLANGIDTNMLFVIDDSASIGITNFITVKDFVKSVVTAFPLSQNRSSGLETFSTGAEVDIPLDSSDTCQFLKDVDHVTFTAGGTDIVSALNLAAVEIHNNGQHPQTLLFLLTDGIDSKNPQTAANALKRSGVIIFGIGVGEYDQNQLEPLTSVGPDGTNNFFGVTNFNIFNTIADYLNTTYVGDQHPCENTLVENLN